METPSPASGWLARPFLRWSAGILLAVVLGALAFELFDISIFTRIGMAHEYCYLREPKLIWLHVTSDLLIGSAYVSISGTLAYLVYRASRGIPFNWVFLAFGLFIVSCGLTHFMEVWVIWEPVYWLSGYVKVITAAASLATAVALFQLVPKVFALIESARRGEQRRVEIEQLNQELERFNYSVAHDLRSPLRGIAGFTHILKEDYADKLPAEAQLHLERIQQSVGRMDALISDLLRYSTVGRQEMLLRPVRLEDALRSATDLIEAEIRETRAQIILQPGLPPVIGDPALLQVVLQNLLANALKFVAPGTTPVIEVRAQTQGRFVRLSIADNGIGIPPEARDKIFRMFERFHPAYPGTGIGLAIVFRAVERMHGRIGIVREPRPQGTEFWLELPAA
jgi:signal transduction histidine kinase